MDARQSFSIAAGKLSDTLLNIAEQADISIAFAAGQEFDIETPEIKGKYSARLLIDKLLQRSALQAIPINKSVIAIRPKECVFARNCKTDEPLNYDRLISQLQIEKLVVIGKPITGSRIRRSEFAGSSPIDIISAFDIELSGVQSLGEILRNLPAVVGNSTSTSISNGGDGTASVTLRGLPASNTLVLFNGRRVANTGLAGESVDLNSLSTAAIDRIEILSSVSSAIYGSDAIAGVINIIFKKDFDGIQIDSFLGRSAENDLDTRTTNLSFGKTLDRAQFFLSATSYDQGGIFSRDRNVSANADTRRFGGEDKRSSAIPASNIFVPGTGGRTLGRDNRGNFFPGTSTTDFRALNDEDRYNFLNNTSAIVPSRRESVYLSADWDMGDQIQGFAEFGYTRNKARTTLAPAPLFTAFETTPILVAADNIFNPFALPIADLRKRMVELGNREFIDSSSSHRYVLGASGDHSRLDWDFSLQWSETRAKTVFRNLLDAARVQRALGPGAQCQGTAIDGCAPLNLFAPPGEISAAQLDFIRTTAESEGATKLQGATLNAVFELFHVPAGRVQAAAGLEYRREETFLRPGFPNRVVIGGANFSASEGRRDIKELYLETQWPLLKSLMLPDKLMLELAARYSRYSDFGSTTNPRLAVKYRPNKGWLLRGSYARGFRAPSLIELYKSSGETQAFLNDPCASSANVGVLPGCTLQSDPTRLQFLTIEGGNRSLSPERSTSASMGVRWTPEFISDLSLTVDAWWIDQKNVIDANAQFILDQNAENGAFADRIVRDANGDITRIVATNINIGERELSGVDVTASYVVPAFNAGRLSLSLNASYISQFDEQLNPQLPTQDLTGTFIDAAADGRGSIPQWKMNFGGYWKYKRWQFNYTGHYVSSLTERLSNRTREIEDWLIHDFQLSYFLGTDAAVRITAGGKNITDEDAPLAASAFNDNIDARTHNLIGRYWYTKLSINY